MSTRQKITTSNRFHFAATIAAAVAFHMACSYSSGWFMPLLGYLLLMASLFSLIGASGALSKTQRAALWVVLLSATPAFVAALWFSGKLTSMY